MRNPPTLTKNMEGCFMATSTIPQKICAVEGCENKKHGYIYCGKHYAKYKAHGDPLGGRRGASPGEPLKWIRDHAAYGGDDCIKWPFEVTRYGYGTVKHNGKKRVASRVMCEVAHGEPLLVNYEAAHSCGNGHLACMNQKHLRWATKGENMKDAIRHGTCRRGRLKIAKVTEKQVEQILSLRGKKKQKEIGEMFGITQAHVAKIHTRGLWGYVADRVGYKHEKIDQKGEQSGNSKLKESDVIYIRKMRGIVKQKELGEMFGVSSSQVGKIQRRVWWSWLK